MVPGGPPGSVFRRRSFFAIRSYHEIPRRSINTLLNCEFSNDCELIARKRFREVDAALSWLLEYAPSRLTGTGACVFAEFNTESAARQVLDTAPAWLNGFVARGLTFRRSSRPLL